MKKFAIVILVLTAAVSHFGQTTKTVTNEDLEKYRQQRIEAERQLKERYAEMGFPSPAERERQIRESSAELEEYSNRLRRERLASQGDIAARANALRAQLASIDAQLDYLRGQTGGSTYKGGTFSANLPFVYSYGYGFRGGARGGNRSPLRQISRLPQNARTAQEYAVMYPSSQSISAQVSGNVRYGGGRVGYGGRGFYRGGYVAPVIVGGSYNANDAGSQIVFLEQTRAGLLAEWRILEEQARRAGIRLD